MKKFIISAISLAILLMAFACAQPSSSDNSNNSNNSSNTQTPTNTTPTEDVSGTTTNGLPKTLVGAYSLVSFKDENGTGWKVEEENLALTIFINADDTIEYQGQQTTTSQINLIPKQKFGDIDFCSAETKSITITRLSAPYNVNWTYEGTSPLKITGYFSVNSDNYSCRMSEMIIRK